MAGARERQAYVLEQMARNGFITQAQGEAALRETPAIRNQAQRVEQAAIKAPHFVNFVRAQIERQYGSDTFFRSGMQVKTTLDLRLQSLGEQQTRAAIDDLRARNAAQQLEALAVLHVIKDFFHLARHARQRKRIRPERHARARAFGVRQRGVDFRQCGGIKAIDP